MIRLHLPKWYIKVTVSIKETSDQDLRRACCMFTFSIVWMSFYGEFLCLYTCRERHHHILLVMPLLVAVWDTATEKQDGWTDIGVAEQKSI